MSTRKVRAETADVLHLAGDPTIPDRNDIRGFYALPFGAGLGVAAKAVSELSRLRTTPSPAARRRTRIRC